RLRSSPPSTVTDLMPAPRSVSSTWSSIWRESARRPPASSTLARRLFGGSADFIGTTAMSMNRSGVLPVGGCFVHEIEHGFRQSLLVHIVVHQGVRNTDPHAECLNLAGQAGILPVEHETVDQTLVES